MSETAKSKINNGTRAAVQFGAYTGEAGVVEFPPARGQASGVTRIAFPGEFRDFRDVKRGTIAGKPYAVTDVARSDPARGGVKGMVVLTLTAVTREM
jgi:hypothetical protein